MKLLYFSSVTEQQQQQQQQPIYDYVATNPLDVEYEVPDLQSIQTKTDDIKIYKNPAYSETRFNS